MSGPGALLDQPSARNIGTSAKLAPGAQGALLDLAGEDSAARSLLVMIDIRPALELSDLGEAQLRRGEDILAARAQIGIGSGGHRIELELDILRGIALSVSASSVRVSAVNDGPAPVEIGAFVTYAEARAHRPSLTRIGPELAVGDAWTLEVPPFAAAVEVLALDVALRVDVGRGRAADRWLYAEQVAASQRMARPLPIANGCSRLRITNAGPNAATPVAIFTLAL